MCAWLFFPFRPSGKIPHLSIFYYTHSKDAMYILIKMSFFPPWKLLTNTPLNNFKLLTSFIKHVNLIWKEFVAGKAIKLRLKWKAINYSGKQVHYCSSLVITTWAHLHLSAEKILAFHLLGLLWFNFRHHIKYLPPSPKPPPAHS